MKTIKVSEATNPQLNWLVPHAQGLPLRKFNGEWKYQPAGVYGGWEYSYPTTNPAQMWPIIDRERISLRYWDNVALIHACMPAADEWEEGETGLIAAARAYIVSKLGEVVEVPEEL